MKLYLDLQCLERLIGGDTAVELELRQCIAKEFAKRHLAEVVRSEAFTKALVAVHAELAAEIKRQVGSVADHSHYYVTEHVAQTTREIIAKTVERVVEEQVNERVDKAVAARTANLSRQCDNAIRAAFAGRVDKLIEEELQPMVRAAMSAHVDALVNAEVGRRLRLAAGVQP